MSRYIKKNDALKAVAKEFYTYEDYDKKNAERIAHEIVDNIFPADVVEVVHSHWIWGPFVAKVGGHGNTCAACGKQSEECGNYCTWCGAKMDDEEQLEAEREKK